MNKIARIANIVFYSILGISLFLAIGIFEFEILKDFYLLLGYLFIYVIIPLLILSLLIILIYNFKRLGFISGIKESSIHIFSLAISFFFIWTLQSYAFEKKNRINVTVVNQTEKGISNITLVGRNAMTKIDTLAPKQNQIAVFKGKRINYKTENDYENVFRL